MRGERERGARWGVVGAGAAVLALALGACGDGGATDASAGAAPATGGASVDAGPVAAVDASGEEVRLDEPAERVVCLDGSCLDALAQLDLEPVASTQGDVVTDAAFFGPDAATTILGGTFFEPDLEGVLAAEPDLVIGSASTHAELRAALAGVPLYLAEAGTEDDAVTTLESVATLTGRDDAGAAAVEQMRATLAAYEPGERPTTVVSMYGGATDDLGIDAADSQIGGLLGQYTAYPWPDAGEGDGGFLETSLEQLLDVDPAHAWVLDFGFDPDAPALVDQLAEDPVWGRLRAVRDGAVHTVPVWWGTTSGTLTRQLLLDTVMPTLYPDEFPEPLGPLSGT